jgi:hypothetical protein
MGKIKVFVKEGCFKCPSAKEVGEHLTREGLEVLFYDLDTADGLAEASFYGVLSTPTMIVEDKDERTLADFRGMVPTSQQVKEILLG